MNVKDGSYLKRFLKFSASAVSAFQRLLTRDFCYGDHYGYIQRICFSPEQNVCLSLDRFCFCRCIFFQEDCFAEIVLI